MALLTEPIDFRPLFPESTEAAVLARKLASAQEIGTSYGITIDVREGSLVRTLLTSSSREDAAIWDSMGTEVPASAMVPWSWSPYIDDLAVPTRIERLAATAATGMATFSSAAAQDIDVGTRIAVAPATPDDLPPSFEVTTGGSIPAASSIDLPIRAVTAGASGNVAANSITIPETPLPPGVTFANAAATVGGTDVETDDAFRLRIINAFRGLGPGTVPDYEEWAGSIAGVGSVTVIPLYAGPGTVLVIVSTDAGGPVSAETLDTLQHFLDPPAFESELTATVTLPVATVPVLSTVGARPPADGWIRLGDQLVSYATFDGDSFNGCAGGTGTFTAGIAVTQSGRGGGEAPVGAYVVVKTAAQLAVTITATLECEGGYSLDGFGGTTALQATIEARLRAYLATVRSGSEVVRSKVAATIVDVTGVHDVDTTTLEINGLTANLPIDDDPPQVPVLFDADLTEGAV